MYLTSRLIRHKLTNGEEVWLNALTGAVDRLSARETRLVDHALAGDQEEDALMTKLRSRGYLYADEKEEEDAFKRLVQQYTTTATGPKAIKHLIVCPTYSCNLKCVYCFEHRSHPDMPRQMMSVDATSKVLKAFSQIRESEPDVQHSMGLFGGEPLMLGNRVVVSRLLAGIDEMGLPVMIVTNGVNISSYLPVIEEYMRSIRVVQVTVDGPEEIHDLRRPTASGRGSFKAVTAAIGILLETGIKVVMRVNIDRDNVRHLPGLTRIAVQRGWTDDPNFLCSLAPVRDHTGTGDIPNVTPDAELLSHLFDVYDDDPETENLFGLEGFQVLGPISGLTRPGLTAGPRVYYCEANHGGFCVAGPDGYLYACPEAIGQPQLAIGRYLPELELWQEKADQWIGRSIKTIAGCSDCHVGPLCGGGCTYSSLVRHGDSSTPVCDSDLGEAVEVFLKRRVI